MKIKKNTNACVQVLNKEKKNIKRSSQCDYFVLQYLRSLHLVKTLEEMGTKKF